MSTIGVSEDEIIIFGSRDNIYTLKEIIRNREYLDEEFNLQATTSVEITTIVLEDNHEQRAILQSVSMIPVYHSRTQSAHATIFNQMYAREFMKNTENLTEYLLIIHTYDSKINFPYLVLTILFYQMVYVTVLDRILYYKMVIMYRTIILFHSN